MIVPGCQVDKLLFYFIQFYHQGICFLLLFFKFIYQLHYLSFQLIHMLSSCEVLDSWKVQSTARTSYALSTFKLVLHVFTSSFSSATLSTFKLVLFTSSSSLATWGPALENTYRGFGGFRFLGESFFHEKMEETAVGWSVLLPASVLWKSESLKCLEQTLVCQDILKWRPTSLRTARIHAANRSLFFGNLWKDIFQSSSR